MLRRMFLTVLLLVGLVCAGGPAYAAGDAGVHNGYSLALNSWPVVLAGLCGIVNTNITAALTHYNAPQWVKSGLNLALATLAGVLITVTIVPGNRWTDYVSEIAVAWIVALGAHYTGLTKPVEKATLGRGFGADYRALVPIAAPLDRGRMG